MNLTTNRLTAAAGLCAAAAGAIFIGVQIHHPPADVEHIVTGEMVENELASVSRAPFNDTAERSGDLSESVERFLSDYFMGFGQELPPAGLYTRVLRKVEFPLITAALAATRGNQIRAADLLGLNRNTLRKKIRDLGIKVIRTPGL